MPTSGGRLPPQGGVSNSVGDGRTLKVCNAELRGGVSTSGGRWPPLVRCVHLSGRLPHLLKEKKEKKYGRAAAGGLRKEERKNVRRSSRDTQGVSKLRLYNKTESFESAKN